MTEYSKTAQLSARLERLETHLKDENPILLDAVRSFRTLDSVGYAMGLLPRDESFATRVPWWPLIAVLGTFSSGKSTFINSYIGQRIQQSGNQAVDDKFSVLCYGKDPEPRVLPGLALDADPRFPFYQISYDIEAVSKGEGRRVDAYLQLKTCHSDRLLGKIIVDSPGFDADEQRTSTLRITDHIIGLSDLVLVFFDARHPEPGAMQDTLEHLVTKTINRPDSNKFLFILNQIDNTAREDNPEDVFAAWQRALASRGLTAGRFYRIYDEQAAIPIEDPARRARFETKRDEDLAEIHARMASVEIERAYRVVGVLEKLARDLDTEFVPRIAAAKLNWRRKVLAFDVLLLAGGLSAAIYIFSKLGESTPEALLPSLSTTGIVALAAVVGLAALVHFQARKILANWTLKVSQKRWSKEEEVGRDALDGLTRAFKFNTRPWSPLFWSQPIGWTGWARRQIAQVLVEADRYVQSLNDGFTNPSGRGGADAISTAAAEPPHRHPQTPAAVGQDVAGPSKP